MIAEPETKNKVAQMLEFLADRRIELDQALRLVYGSAIVISHRPGDPKYPMGRWNQAKQVYCYIEGLRNSVAAYYVTNAKRVGIKFNLRTSVPVSQAIKHGRAFETLSAKDEEIPTTASGTPVFGLASKKTTPSIRKSK